MSKLMMDIKDIPALMNYLPDYAPGKRFVDRDFFWKVIFAVRPVLA
jgi:hypothetical protein